MTDQRPTLRFAPSPTGELHIGHAYSALFTAAMARRLGGRFLLRIEDTDQTRCRSEFEAAIYEDLAWLGLAWEEPVRRQSEHPGDYAAALDALRALGVVYPCFASRKEIAEAAARLGADAPRDPDGAPLYRGLYRGADRAKVAERVAAGEPHALRLDMEKALAAAMEMSGGAITFTSFDDAGRTGIVAVDPARWGDVLLASRDRPASYHLAVVTDDALQAITHVTRGADLLAATDVHRVLQILLRLPAPLYCHHRLILDPSGRKLAKSARDKSLQSLRAEGVTADEVRRRLGF
jgi:glutamyl-Q tRNA(Asp) synthetase